MELRHLRHFVAVAEELHFGRAAAKLGMRQPPLSQSIRRLESSLGAELFQRTAKSICLTPAGQALLEDARSIVAQASVAERRVQVAARGERDRINMGYLPWSMVRSVPQAVRTFSARWPGVKIRLLERSSHQQVEALRTGQLDLGIVSLRNADTSGLQTRILERSELALAVPAKWSLAKSPKLNLRDIRDAPFIAFSPRLSPKSHSALLAACEVSGFAPRIVHETGQPLTMLNMVANELGIALIQSTAAMMSMEGVVIVPLADAPASLNMTIAIAWDVRLATPVLFSLIRLLEEATASCTDPTSSTMNYQ